MRLKDFILQKAGDYIFREIKVKTDIKEQEVGILKNTYSYNDFLNLLFNLDNRDVGNFLFLTRVLDFRLWEFAENWFYKGKRGYYALAERVKDLFLNDDIKTIDFKNFKEIISPFESSSLATLRFRLFQKSVKWLVKRQEGFFDNYFERNKKPLDFCLNLFELRKFKDFHKNFYFLKPNQLLYLEYIVGRKMEKDFRGELEELTIFADCKIPAIFLKLGFIEVLRKKRLKDYKLKNNSLLENELRWASIVLGETISKILKTPSYKIDNLLWSLSQVKKLADVSLRVKTIFY